MRKKLLEGSVLFISIMKWLFLASCVGVIVGLSTTVFLKALESSIGFASGYKYYFLLLPAAFFLSAAIIKYLAPEAKGHGTEKVIEAVHKRSGRINPFVVPVKLVATVITIATGGSAGKEGPCAQIGAGLSSLFAAIGMVSLLAGAANTPVSASIMSVELFGPQVAPYAAVSCVISFLMTGYRSVYPSQILAIEKSSSISVEKGTEMKNIQDIEFHHRPKSIIGGIADGLKKVKKEKKP